MRRREFIILLGGTAATIALPLAARAQKPERMRRIGVLMSLAENDPEGQARIAAFLQALQQLGWIDGRNLRVDTRWAAGNADHNRDYANELVALAPDVLLATGSGTVAQLLRATRDIPIVFVLVPIRLAPRSSIALRGRVVTSPAFCSSNTALAGNGWNCSKRSRRV